MCLSILYQYLVKDIVHLFNFKVIDLSNLYVNGNLLLRYKRRGFTFIGQPTHCKVYYNIPLKIVNKYPIEFITKCEDTECLFTYMYGNHEHCERAQSDDDFSYQTSGIYDIINYINVIKI